MDALKNENYWNIVRELRNLKEISNSTYIYVLADTGLVSDDGEVLCTFIFDAHDVPAYTDIEVDGLGTTDIAEETVHQVYLEKKRMEWVSYYSGDYGELYYTFTPVFDDAGQVIAILGTDLELGSMNSAIAASTMFFNAIFLAFFVIMALSIFILLRVTAIISLASKSEARRDNLLKIVNRVASVMLSAEVDDNFDNAFLSGMALIGGSLSVDRVQIWKNDTIDGAFCFIHKFEWLSETGKLKPPVPIDLMFPYSERARWLEMFMRNEHINCPFTDLPREEQEFLGAFDIKTIVIIPIFLQDQFWGFFSIDDCENERTFPAEEIDILHSASLMMASAINRHTMFESSQKAETDLRLARDAAETANYAKSAFLANMSHEIRTPMNSIIGFTELAMDDEMPLRTKDYLDKIYENSEWLLQIINDVLDLSKIESGKLTIENIPFDLHEVFTHCQTMIMPKAIEKGIAVHFYAEPSIGKKLIGDPTRLRQVLINLISNAVKFTRIGTVKVSSYITGSTDRTISVHFEVRDSGIGMTQDQIERIYEPFTQADTSTTRKYGGTGLGLPISHRIISLMNGKLEVDSIPEVGSKFGFDLTFNTIDVPVELSVEKVAKNMVKKPIFSGEVLVCEDNAMNQKVICDHLNRVGLKPVVAHNGREGLDVVKKRIEKGDKMFDLIFMDIYMPVMDGLETAAAISKLKTGIPIVAMTANIMPEEIGLYEQSGMPDCLSKPFTSQELWQCLMRYMEPVGREDISDKPLPEEDMRLQLQLQKNFVKDNQDRINEIDNAIDEGDVKLAHRLAHSLKTNAGLIGRSGLQDAAAVVEKLLKDGNTAVEKDVMNRLEHELKKVLDEFTPILYQSGGRKKQFNKEQVLQLFDKLEPMLNKRNPECQNLLDDINCIPGAETLAEQVEDFDFKSAIATLAGLRDKWNLDHE